MVLRRRMFRDAAETWYCSDTDRCGGCATSATIEPGAEPVRSGVREPEGGGEIQAASATDDDVAASPPEWIVHRLIAPL